MTIRKRRIALALFASVFTATFAGPARSQELTVYAPIAPEYRLGDFRYNAPREDGWRQVASNPGMFVLVYAESLPPDQILTRLTVIAEAHPIEPETREMVEDGQWLARQSFGQQSDEREGRIVAYSPIQAVGDNDVYKYTLVTKGNDEKDTFESFYLKLAADRSAYWIAKFTTSESDFQDKIYLEQFENSLASLRIEGVEAQDESGTQAAAGAAEEGGAGDGETGDEDDDAAEDSD